ncbi:hypothetical protein [Pyrobaculum ferrireducens]|uniref:hypothetical protein n=1 Tax=Pyrobaculum ferrireducens TaxID=1104324 RepID=UPI0011E535C5|nr:hypothetical protein [Pyrobaculum ferrireducens]
MPVAFALAYTIWYVWEGETKFMISGDFIKEIIEKIIKSGILSYEKALEILGEKYAHNLKGMWLKFLLILILYYGSLIDLFLVVHKFWYPILSIDVASHLKPLLVTIWVVLPLILSKYPLISPHAIALARGVLKARIPNFPELLIRFAALYAPVAITPRLPKDKVEIIVITSEPIDVRCYGMPQGDVNHLCKAIRNSDKIRRGLFASRVLAKLLEGYRGLDVRILEKKSIDLLIGGIMSITGLNEIPQIKCSEMGDYLSHQVSKNCLIRGIANSLQRSYASMEEFLAIFKVVIDTRIPMTIPAERTRTRMPDVLGERLCFCELYSSDSKGGQEHITLIGLITWGKATEKVKELLTYVEIKAAGINQAS